MDNPAFEIRETSPPALGHGKGSVEMVDISGDVIKETNSSKVHLDHIDDTDYVEPDIFGQLVVNFRSYIHEAFVSNKRKFKILAILISILLFHIYLILAIRHSIVSNKLDWCGGTGFLIILTSLTYWIVFYDLVLKRLLGKKIQRAILLPLAEVLQPIWTLPYISVVLGLLCFGAILTFIVLDAWEQPKRLVSASGVLVVLVIGLLLSKHPGRVKWRQVFWGLGLQFVFAVIILRWDSGRDAFDCMSSKVKTFLDFTDHGTRLVYGYLATGYNNTLESGENVYLPPVFLFKALSVIFFFSFFISLLYHYGVMMAIISKLGWFLQITVGTTAAESMSAAANIFIGQTEAPILIKPFLPEMTKSELHAVMTGGFATIAGSVMGAYISFGINPSYLLSASIMAAPAALAMSKLIYPETVRSKTTADQLKSFSLRTTGSALDAAAQGATQGVMLIGNIAANVIAFMAFVAFLNSLFSWCGSLLGFEELTFEWLLGKLFIPMAYVIGVDGEEVEDVALLLGLKTVVNEFVAYQRLVSPSMQHLSARSRAITTYALCSFANFSSIGVQLGGIGFMAPERRTELAETIWYAFVAGTFCGLLNACLAGTLLSSPGYQMALNTRLALTVHAVLEGMGLYVLRGTESTMKADGPIQHEQSDIVGRCVVYLRSKLLNFLLSYAAYLKFVVVTLVAILYHVYLVAVVQYTQNNNKFEWCNGSGFLYILTGLVYWGLFYYCILKGLLRSPITTALKPIASFVKPIRKNRYSSSVLTLSCVIGVIVYVVIDAKNDPRRIVSAAGVIAIVGIALLVSKHPGRVQWRSVAWGILVQVFLAMVVIRWKTGQDASLCVSEKVTTFLNFAEAGSGFVYGYLASGFNQTISTGDHIELPGIFAFKPLSIIFFFNFIVGFLHHYGILMWIIQKIGWFLEVVIGTTAVESTGAAANVFLGQSEVFLLNKPFLLQMTKSEIHALMTAGLATVAGSEYGLLLSFGISANYLITASLMAAPASLALSKLIYPETEQSVTSAAEMKKLDHRTSISALDAAARGATESVILIGTIIANLVAFIATVAFLNAILGWFSALVGAELTFEMLVGKLFIPFAYITGVDQSEVEDVAVLLGLKTVVNEVVAYRKLVSPEMAHLSARTRVIATHALCSFANIGSVGIQLGAVTFICPERRKDVINTIWYALVSGSLCGLLNACVIGALIS